MTNSSDRIDRMEALLEQFIAASTADRQESNERLTRIEQLVESNSRSIQASSDELVEFRLTIAEEREQTAEERQELREAILRLTTLNEGVINLLGSLDSDRPTILRKLSTIENECEWAEECFPTNVQRTREGNNGETSKQDTRHT